MRISVVTTLLLLSLTGVAYAQEAVVGLVTVAGQEPASRLALVIMAMSATTDALEFRPNQRPHRCRSGETVVLRLWPTAAGNLKRS